MGCTVSKIENEESVARCRERKRFIKEAVQHRHAFAAAHAAYTVSLKNAGAALRQFGEGEDVDPTASLIPPLEPLLRPPPPPPSLPASPKPLSRAASMPLPVRTQTASPERTSRMSPPTTVKEEQEGEYYVLDAPPPPPPPADSHAPPPPSPPRNLRWGGMFDVFSTTEHSYQIHDAGTPEVQGVEYMAAESKITGEDNGTLESEEEEPKEEVQEAGVQVEKAPKKAVQQQEEKPESIKPEKKEKGELQVADPQKSKTGVGKELMQALRKLDDKFLEAFESGKEVSRMLEARKMHYHSNFADPDGLIDHRAKVLSIISWSRHSSRTPLANGDAMGSIYNDEKETHASTLDKLLAWEKKLYDDVKAGEVIRIALEKKSTQLKNQKERKEDPITIDKTKALVKSLQTRYLVEFQAVDSDSLEIQRLRDEHLYKQLEALVYGLSEMWKVMFECHQQQYQIVEDVKAFENSSAPEEISEFHRNNTLQLETEINLWHQNFEKLMTTQKEYMNALYSWLRLNIIQIESEVKDNLASPQKMVTPPVYHLCKAWLQALEKPPGNVALQALKNFSTIINEMVMKQADEIKQKKKLETLSKELEKKKQSLSDFERKYSEKHMDRQTPDENQELIQGGEAGRNPLQEKKTNVDLLGKKVEEERERHKKLCSQCYSMTVTSLKTGLPPILRAITEFAHSCSDIYEGLRELTVSENLPQNLQLGY